MLIPAPFIAFPHVSPPSRSFDVADAATVIGGDGGDSIDPNDPPGKGAPAVFPPETVKTADNGGRYVDGKDGIVARSSVEHPWIVYLPADDLDSVLAAIQSADGLASVRFVATNDVSGTLSIPYFVTNAVVWLQGNAITGASGTPAVEGSPAIDVEDPEAGNYVEIVDGKDGKDAPRGGAELVDATSISPVAILFWDRTPAEEAEKSGAEWTLEFAVDLKEGVSFADWAASSFADGLVSAIASTDPRAVTLAGADKCDSLALLSVATTPDPADITKGLVTLGLAPVADYPTDLFVRVHVAPSSRAPAGTSAVVSVNEVGYQQLDLVAGFNLVAPQFTEIGSDSIGIQSMRLNVADEDATGGDCVNILDENGNPIESFYWFPAEWIGTDMSGWLDAETGLLSETGLENGVSVNVHSEQETSLMVHGEVQMADVGRSVTFGYNMIGNPYPVSIGIQSIQLCVPDEDVSGGDCLNVLDENGNPVASYYWFPGEWIGSETSGWLDAETGELSNVEILPGQGLLLDSTVNDVVVTIKSPFKSVP